MWPLQETTNESDKRKGVKKVPDCEREKRKESGIITHRATCKAKYHLFVCKYKYWSTHLYVQTLSHEAQGNGISAKQSINIYM